MTEASQEFGAGHEFANFMNSENLVLTLRRPKNLGGKDIRDLVPGVGERRRR